MDFYRLMQGVAYKMQFFLKEADFQCSLATEIQKQYPDSVVRVEFTPK